MHGEIRLTPFQPGDELPDELRAVRLRPGPDTDLGADSDALRPARLRGARRANDAWLVRFEGVDDRDAAQALAGNVLCISTADLPPLGEGEFYLHEIIGARAVGGDGQSLGTVAGFVGRSEQDLLRLTTVAGERLIPLADETVVAFDREHATVTLDVAPGLLD